MEEVIFSGTEPILCLSGSLCHPESIVASLPPCTSSTGGTITVGAFGNLDIAECLHCFFFTL